jgi:pimeloyl-ACP methyl ester carboxylesterase
MPAPRPTRLLALFVALGATAAAAQRRPPKVDLKRPLVIASQGSFFVGGDTRPLNGPGPAGDVTVNQMYVQYQAPPNADRLVPVVMVHGCCLSSKTWETTPDGRMGWDEYFVRLGRAVYLADQVSRGRSGFDASVFGAVKAGSQPPSQLPNILFASRQVAWTVFRFGPKYGTAFPDGQFPVEAADELYKQMIPDLNALLPSPNPTWKNMAALAAQLKGAILMGHSESGFFPERAALIDPAGIRGMISIEQPCPADLSEQEIAALAKIPTLMVFGDHLGDVTGGPANWQASFDGCQAYVKRVVAAGGDAEMMHLPALGIRGNSHMLMQDRNNLQVADLIAGWVDNHVDRKGKR